MRCEPAQQLSCVYIHRVPLLLYTYLSILHYPNQTQGLRITVPGRVGQSLLDVAQMHDVRAS